MQLWYSYSLKPIETKSKIPKEIKKYIVVKSFDSAKKIPRPLINPDEANRPRTNTMNIFTPPANLLLCVRSPSSLKLFLTNPAGNNSFSGNALASTIVINPVCIPISSFRRAKIPVNQEFSAEIPLNFRPILVPLSEDCQGRSFGQPPPLQGKVGSGSKLTHLFASKSEGIVGFFSRMLPNIEYLETGQIGAFYGVFWRDILQSEPD